MSDASAASVYASEDYLVQLLAKAVAAKASDIHLKVGQPPGARIRGEIVYFRAEPLTETDTHHLASHIIADDTVRLQLDHLTEYDAAYSARGVGRFRVNIFRQRGSLAIVMRTIPFVIPTFDELGAPAACVDALREGARAGARRRRGRQRKELDARGDDRPPEPLAGAPHRDGRRSDRVPAPRRQGERQPARESASTRRASPTRCAPRSARTRT